MWLPLKPDPMLTIRRHEVIRCEVSQSVLMMDWWMGLTRILSYPWRNE